MKETVYQYLERMPKHVAIIMDGNGRWAKKNTLKVALGHRQGMYAVRDIVRESSKLGIKVLSIYAFSTENWKRSPAEVGALMKLINEFFDSEFAELHANQVKIRVIGDLAGLPEEQQAVLKEAIERTKDNTGLVFNVALNYGGRDEILRAVRKVTESHAKGELALENLTEEGFAKYLYTEDCPDVDLLIRTSGEMRLSNFLLYQVAYAEFVFPEVLWPDFTVEEYHKALLEYIQRDRRFGGRQDE